MSVFNIEEYLNSLPDDKTIIDVSKKGLTYLPSLSRFHSLEILYCFSNKLTSLPELNSSLKQLHCADNKLTSLPKLNNSLRVLHCTENKLTSLPELNHSLEQLMCYDNQLTSLPKINNSLIYLYCQNNPLPYNLIYYGRLTINNVKNKLNNNIQILVQFKHLYMSLKYKKQFRNWLWIKVRLPKTQTQYHPDKLKKLLSGVNDTDEEEFEHVLSNW